MEKGVNSNNKIDYYDEFENKCNNCKFEENTSNEKPCNSCLQWVEGYLSATNYENKFL